jgi:thimet oligopeptidase
MVQAKQMFAAVVLSAALLPACTAANQFPGAAIVNGTVEQFNTACKADLGKALVEIARLKAMKAPRNTLQALRAFDNAVMAINFAANRSEVVQAVVPDESMRNAAEKCGQAATASQSNINLDRAVYDAIVALDIAKADAATRYLVKQILMDFRRAGVDRDDATRAKIAALNDDLTKIGQEFDKNIAQGGRKVTVAASELDGMPEDYKKAHPAGADGQIVLTTAYPDYMPFMKYAKSSPARERFYRAYYERAYPENIAVLDRLLAKRYELATTLGYKNWADYATENKMIGNAQNASDFIAKITGASDARMKKDYAELVDVAKLANPAANQIQAWDLAYFSEQLRATKYNFDAQSVRPYFEYKRVKDGLFGIVGKMDGVQFRPVKNVKVWHASVEVYDIYEGKKALGRIYLDMFPRANKFSHAENLFLNAGRKGTYLPEIVLACNFADPSKGPALMEHGDVTTFFHEFGHTMHLIFSGQPKWSSYSFQWDFIESPSQMFEDWAINPTTLHLFAKHYQTGQVIPTALVERLRGVERVGRGLNVRRQMSLAALSLDLHNGDPKAINSDEVLKSTIEQYTPFQYVPDTHAQAAFGHLQGYSAYYYTYMWSLVIAKDMLTEFQKVGLMNPSLAARYRKTVLEPGASQPAAQLLTNFLGRPYTFDAYKRWLDKDE